MGGRDPHLELPEEVRSRARAAAEAALAGVSGYQLLFLGRQRAEQARDRVYREALEAQRRQDEARREEEAARRQQEDAARSRREAAERREEPRQLREQRDITGQLAERIAAELEALEEGEPDEDDFGADEEEQ